MTGGLDGGGCGFRAGKGGVSLRLEALCAVRANELLLLVSLKPKVTFRIFSEAEADAEAIAASSVVTLLIFCISSSSPSSSDPEHPEDSSVSPSLLALFITELRLEGIGTGLA